MQQPKEELQGDSDVEAGAGRGKEPTLSRDSSLSASTSLKSSSLPSYGALDRGSTGKSSGDVRVSIIGNTDKAEKVSILTTWCFLCLSLAAFLGDGSRGLLAPSLAPYIVEAGGTATFVGWTNGVYSVGRLIAAPLFGWWAEHRTFKEAIMINLIIYVLGSFIYAVAEHNKWLILFSRLLAGLGSGTLGLSRGYIAQTTTNKDRAGYIAWLTAAQFIGYTVTPGLGALLSFVNIPIVGVIAFNQYTSGGYLLALLGIINAAMLFYAWIEPPEESVAKDSSSKVTTTHHGSGHWWDLYLSPIVIIFVVLMFLTRFVVAVYETISQLLANDVFLWGVFEFGMISTIFGVVGTIVLLAQKPLGRYISDEWVLVFGLTALSIGLSIFPPLSTFSGNLNAELAQYNIGSILIFGFGYPITQALLLAFFSKALGPVPQSTIMGMMASLGSFAKVIGSLAAGSSFQAGQMGLCFYIPAAFLGASSVGAAFYVRKLHKEQPPKST